MTEALPHGLVAGDRVVLVVPGSPAYAETVIALLRRGVFPVPMDPSLTVSERAGLLADLEPALVLEDQHALEDLLAALAASQDPSDGPPMG